jgi:hypothetical protein
MKVFLFLLVAIVFTLSISQVFALQQIAGPITVEIKPGESKTFQWGLASDSDVTTNVELRSEGRGSEFLSFTKTINIEPRQFASAEFTVTIPADHPGGVDLMPSLYATEFGEQGGPTVINIQMKKIPTIKIAINDNPEFRSNTAYDYQLEEQSIPNKESNVEQPKTTEQGQTTIVNPSVTEVKSTEPAKSDSIPKCGTGTIEKDGICVPAKQETTKGGGCLIATATYGSELAPQVQQLRELRDGQLLQTESGISFMSSFNDFYYSFSPTISDLERQSPIFKEVVKITITPLITSLSILNYADMDSEASVLGYGISLIILNMGMYFVAPAIVIHTIRKKF